MNKSRVGALIICYILLLIVGGCGSSVTKGLVGTWVDEEDKITFFKDGSFKANYYFMNGEWEEFENGKVDIIQNLAGSEKYFYEINDEGILTLINAVKQNDGSWSKGGLCYKFVREGQDKSILNNNDTLENVDDEQRMEDDIFQALTDNDVDLDASSSTTSSTVAVSDKDYSEDDLERIIRLYLNDNEEFYSSDHIVIFDLIDNVLSFDVMSPNEDGDHPMCYANGEINMITFEGGHWNHYTDDIDYDTVDCSKYFK